MATLLTESGSLETEEAAPEAEAVPARRPADPSRRRFMLASIVGALVALPLELWVLWDMWSGSVNALRAVPYSTFYDLQARALFHGHLYLPGGTMGIEAFVHNGHDYTYFGLFPSLIRMPVLLLTSRLDGQLTAPSILLAWVLTGLFTALMFWRLRVLIRGDAPMGRVEATSFGVLMATVMGGSVVLFLAATPFVYNEDFAWSIPLTIGALFALLGVLERPSWGRVSATGFLILCANLNRSPSGWGCSIAAVLVAVWFALGKEGASKRRWALPTFAAGLVPFVAGCAATYAKFGIPIGLPMADQVWASINAHRRYFLAANGGKAFSFGFLPSTLSAYFQPLGLRISGIFPFFRPPAAPAPWLAGAVLDQTYPTASFTATSPLLFLLGCWGVVAAVVLRATGRMRLTWFVLLGAAACTGGVLLWGYIAQRYRGDVVPFFIIAAGIGLIDVCRRLEGRSRVVKVAALGAISAACVYCIAANVAIASFPANQWTLAQNVRFVSFEESWSISSLANSVQRGTTLPYWGPAGQLFAMDNCSGLYLSTGNDMTDVPGQQIEHYTWKPVEQSPSFVHIIGVTFNRPASELTQPVTLLTYGKSRLVLEPVGDGLIRLQLYDSGTNISWPSPVTAELIPPAIHHQLRLVTTVDPNLGSLVIRWTNAENILNHYVAGHGPAVVKSTVVPRGTPPPTVTIADVPVTAKAPLTLCRSLTQSR
jgi:hypothetical protein